MSVNDLFSKRQKRLRGDVPDVYTYDRIPDPLRRQIVHIWNDTLGAATEYQMSGLGTRMAYTSIVQALSREYGLLTLSALPDYPHITYIEHLHSFFLSETEPDRVLDAIELSFSYIDHYTRHAEYFHDGDFNKRANDAIEELNMRFREHGVGYEFTGGEIIRVDSQLLHVEAVKPALALLQAEEYLGAQAEFLNAHEHYRHGRMKEALADCLKAMESVMKAICAKRKWTLDPRATASDLTKVLFDHGLVPPFLQSHFNALKSTLDSGVPTVRNKLAGHGQGTQVVEVPRHLVAYVLHLTASVIVFLAEAENALP